MNAKIEYLLNSASATEIVDHLLRCDTHFVPPLSNRVEINDYAAKIVGKAARFEAWSGGMLIGLVAAYCDDQKSRIAYVTSVSVLRKWLRRGIAARLMTRCIAYAEKSGMRQIKLEVASENVPAIRLYEKRGFVVSGGNAPFITMNLYFNGGEEHEQRA